MFLEKSLMKIHSIFTLRDFWFLQILTSSKMSFIKSPSFRKSFKKLKKSLIQEVLQKSPSIRKSFQKCVPQKFDFCDRWGTMRDFWEGGGRGGVKKWEIHEGRPYEMSPKAYGRIRKEEPLFLVLDANCYGSIVTEISFISEFEEHA